MPDLSHARILILATDGFEESELFDPRKALLDAGAQVTLASLKNDEITGEKDGEKGRSIAPDLTVDQVDVGDYDALLLPGGVGNPDKLRMNERAVDIVEEFMELDKPVAAICHGPWLLAEADMIAGRKLTSWPSIRTDLENADAEWVNEAIVVDGNLITSRKPDDIPVFSDALMTALAQLSVDA